MATEAWRKQAVYSGFEETYGVFFRQIGSAGDGHIWFRNGLPANLADGIRLGSVIRSVQKVRQMGFRQGRYRVRYIYLRRVWFASRLITERLDAGDVV